MSGRAVVKHRFSGCERRVSTIAGRAGLVLGYHSAAVPSHMGTTGLSSADHQQLSSPVGRIDVLGDNRGRSTQLRNQPKPSTRTARAVD